MRLLITILISLLEVIPSGKAFLKPLQQRDSILIADQLEYGFTLEGVAPGTQLALPDYSEASNDTLTLVRPWKIDTLKARKGKPMDISASVVIAPFEEGTYHLPEIVILREQGGRVDTLSFEAAQMDVKTMPVDTATFEIHDIKGQMTYPLTFRELLPYLGGLVLLAALVVLAVWLIRRSRARREALEHKDPPHILALRELDRYRSDKYWAPEKQKAFYSGITDALKNYIDARFGVDAPEMTTAELFSAIKGEKDITPELWSEMKELFERADFVKFAKFVADDNENAKALPAAVRFVTSTYQAEVEEENNAEEAAGK